MSPMLRLRTCVACADDSATVAGAIRLFEDQASAGTSGRESVNGTEPGDEAAFRGMVERYSADLFRLAVSVTGNRADAADIVQETLLADICQAVL